MSYDSVVLADHPAVYWPCSEASGASTVADATGNGWAGAVNGVTLGLAGDGQTCAQFDGDTPTHIDSAFNPGTASEVTFEAWFNVNGGNGVSFSGAQPRLIASGTGALLFNGSSQGIAVTPLIYFASAGDSQTVLSSVDIENGDTDWHHIVATWDGATIKLYLDAIIVGEAALAGPMGSNPGNTLLGYQSATAGGYSGLAERFAIYPTALTQAQVTAHNIAGGGTGGGGDTTYTLWNGAIPSGTTATVTGLRTDGIQFTVSSTCELTELGFYVPSTETDFTGSDFTGLLWTTTDGLTGTEIASQAGSGTWTAGAWNWITLATPVTLSPGVTYVAGITSPDAIQYVHNYWTTGGPGASGVTSGPVNVPSYASALNNGQQGNISGAGFPASSTGSWYGIDIRFTTSGGPDNGTGSISAPEPALSGSGAQSFPGSGGIAAGAPTLAGSGGESFPSTGGITVGRPSLTGSASETFTGSGAVTAHAAQLAGTGQSVNVAGGAVTAAHPVLTGTAVQRFTGAGAVTAGRPALAGTAVQRFEGSGAVTAQTPVLSSSAPPTFGTAKAGVWILPRAVAGQWT